MMTQRLRNREVLYQEVHNQIEPEAIEAMITYVQDTIGDSKLYGGIDIKHALYLMLNKYCYNKSNKGLEKQFNYPHANFKQVFGTLRRKLLPWARAQIYCAENTYEDRLKIAVENIDDEEFQDVTLCMDEVHFEVEARGKFMQNHRSHKMQKPSIGYIFTCTQDMIINFVSKGWNAQKHSMRVI